MTSHAPAASVAWRDIATPATWRDLTIAVSTALPDVPRQLIAYSVSSYLRTPWRYISVLLLLLSLYSIVSSALEVLYHGRHYINLRFTYLFTYLLTVTTRNLEARVLTAINDDHCRGMEYIVHTASIRFYPIYRSFFCLEIAKSLSKPMLPMYNPSWNTVQLFGLHIVLT